MVNMEVGTQHNVDIFSFESCCFEIFKKGKLKIIPCGNIAFFIIPQAGIDDENLNWNQKQVSTALTNLINDERGRWILAEDHTEQDNELSLTGMHDGQLITAIIDRTFVDKDGTRWIVDYKSSRHDGPDLDAFLDQEQERYAEQLQKYGKMMQAMDSRPIRLGLYFPILKGWRML